MLLIIMLRKRSVDEFKCYFSLLVRSTLCSSKVDPLVRFAFQAKTNMLIPKMMFGLSIRDIYAAFPIKWSRHMDLSGPT